ncbi:MAG TPA: hypothetical protein VLD67_12000 [Vicinamibacterales bacterium]|nr:hypothetical protein [Vicinamibacterales bacterium]
MIKYVLLVPAAALLALGVERLHVAARSRQPAAVTCEQFVRARPSSQYVRLSKCEIDAAAAGYRESGGRIQELFFPVRQPGAPTTRPVAAVIATRDPAALTLAQTVLGAQSITRDESAAAMQQVVAGLDADPDITGTIRGGFLDRLGSSRILSSLGTPVTPDAALIDLHATPDLSTPSITIAVGLMLLAAVVWLSRSATPSPVPLAPTRIEPSPVVTERLMPYVDGLEPAGDVPADPGLAHDSGGMAVAADRTGRPDSPVEDAGRRVHLPALLMLNLDAAAGEDAIETAPPLGSREDVIAMVRGVIPAMEADAAGRLVIRETDYELVCEIGARDPVPTAVVRASGDRGIELLRELLDMTGWRAFAPKSGRFASPDGLRDLIADRDPSAVLS